MSGSPTVDRVLRGQLCSGCGLCASLTGGQMVVSPSGFNRPLVGDAVDQRTEEVIASSCPGSAVHPWSGSAHPYWGPNLEVCAAYATDPTLRHTGSSGGVISALLAHALRTNLVDGALEISPDIETPTRNRVVISRTPEDVLAGAGSRYAPSSPLETIWDLLNTSEQFIFVGKPCDVSALRLLGQSDRRVERVFPIILSFFCAGIPSLSGSDRILSALGVDPSEIEQFRYRGHGWPGHATAIRTDGSEVRMSYKESWGGHLSKVLQFRCKICPDAVGGSADLVCADAWYGTDTGYPAFDEMPGRSLVIARSQTGSEFLQAAVAAQDVEVLETIPLEDIARMQPSQARRKRLIKARMKALKTLSRPVPRMKGLAVDAAAANAPFLEQLLAFFGTVKRVWQRNAADRDS